jgi:hypothetical protein
MTNDKVTISDEARMRAFFEAEINREARVYNLMPADGSTSNQVYWSLHTDRAYKVFKLGVEFARKENGNG